MLWGPIETCEWFGITLLAALGLLGIYLVSTVVFYSTVLVERSTDFMRDGGELIGFVLAIAVMGVAIPITALLRAVNRGSSA